LHGVDEQQGRILGTLTFGGDPFIPVVENDGVLPLLDRRAQIHVHRTDASKRRRGQPADFATTLKVDEDDCIPGSMVRQRDAAAEREGVARPAGRIEAGEFCTRREVVQRKLIASGDGDDLRGALRTCRDMTEQ
jgi:hypothetical protein